MVTPPAQQHGDVVADPALELAQHAIGVGHRPALGPIANDH
jgi:hypothetical protein